MKKIILILSVLFVSSLAIAVPRSSVALGSGGGGVASVEPGESSFMNPATLVHLKGRHFFSTFQKDIWAVSLIENDPSTAVPGAFTYTKDTEANADSQVFGMTFSDFIFENISGGMTLNYWQSKMELTDERRKSAFNGSLGVAWSPTTRFGFGASFENIVSRPDEFKDLGLMEPTSRFGMNYILQEWFRVRLDFMTHENNDFSKLTPQAGMETYFGKWLIFRMGWNKPPKLRESWSAGLGFDLPRFRFDYSSQWNVEGSQESRHSIDLGVPF